jgi:acetyl esterase/lipase
VVLLHQSNGDARQWDSFGPRLRRAGYTVLTFDGRGGMDIRALAHEARGAVGYLRARPDVDPRRIALVGASIGASTATWLAAQDRAATIAATVALSPADDTVFDELRARGGYRPREVLFASDDKESDTMSRFLPGATASRSVVQPRGGHGVDLLETRRVRQAVLRWLRQRMPARA